MGAADRSHYYITCNSLDFVPLERETSESEILKRRQGGLIGRMPCKLMILAQTYGH